MYVIGGWCNGTRSTLLGLTPKGNLQPWLTLFIVHVQKRVSLEIYLKYPNLFELNTIGESFVTSLFTFCFLSIRALVSYWKIWWAALNNDRVLKDKFCQKIWVQYIRCFLRNACLKTRVFTADVWLINYFATQLFCVFLKTNIFLKTEPKKLKFFDK